MKIKIGMIGLGNRGSCLLDTILSFKEVQVVAVSDVYEDRMAHAAGVVEYSKQPTPKMFSDYRKLLECSEVDAVIIATSWETHVEVATCAMLAKKATALEVGGALEIDDCWTLVKTYEATKTPFMLLENCCYDKSELLATSMARKGLFGEIVYCSGAYSHDLREEITTGNTKRHYRLKNYINRNCENYPTHELGPIAKLLDINRGNRMMSLVSFDSKAVGLESYVNERKETIDKALIGQKFRQGDIINTLIKCANGETISMVLDTTLPVFYDRQLVVRGVKGMYNQSMNYVVLDSDDHSVERWTGIENSMTLINNAVKYEKEYLPPLWRDVTDHDRSLGHGGMDGFILNDFIQAIINKTEMPIDIYDAAAWMSITALSEQSIALGNTPIPIPDFTKGQWQHRPRKDVIKL